MAVKNDGTSVTYLPNDGQQLTNPMHRYEQVDGQTLGYDLKGNLLEDGENTYTYDVQNQQIGMSGPGGTAEYIYDALGRRVAKIVDSVTTYYVYNAFYQVLEERDGSNQLLARYTYGAGIDKVLTMERGGSTYTYHRDALGSITEVTNTSGSLVERYEYDVYGTASSLTAAILPSQLLPLATRTSSPGDATTPKAATTTTAPACIHPPRAASCRWTRWDMWMG